MNNIRLSIIMVMFFVVLSIPSMLCANTIIERPETTTYHPLLPVAEVFTYDNNYSDKPLGTIISGITFDEKKINFIIDRLVGKVFPHLLHVSDEVLLQPIFIPYEESYIHTPEQRDNNITNNHVSFNDINPVPVPSPGSFSLLIVSILVILLLESYQHSHVIRYRI